MTPAYHAPIASRRAFLGGAGGFVIGVALPLAARAQSETAAMVDAAVAKYAANAFVQIGADNSVTVLIKHIEFGQGPWTGLATLVAEELDADWSQMRAEHAPSDAALYGNAIYGGDQVTGGSSSMASSFDVMRKAGAAARAMLVAAAADRWRAPASSLTVSKGVISHPASRRSATFGDFAEAAAAQTPPADPTLKTPDDFVYIGKSTPKLDTREKSTGEAIYTLDVYRDGMLTVVVEHPRYFGAAVGSFDDSRSRALPGVRSVKKISSGVAVYARNTHAALRGRKALSVTWDLSNAEKRSSAEMTREWRERTKSEGAIAGEKGAINDGFAAASAIHEAEYVFPYLAHAPMEPLDAVIDRTEDGGIEVWMGSQYQTSDHAAIAEVCNVELAKVKLNTMLAGGSFGRRAQQDGQFAREAAEIFMAAGGQTPIKLMWTREDDIQGGFYRPLMVHRLRGGLNKHGDIVAWKHVMAGQSILAGSSFEESIEDGIDYMMVEGAAEIPYGVPNFQASAHIVDSPVTTLWWRSVGYSHNAYAVETFIDELLAKTGKDSVEGRLALMGDEPRLGNVLRKAADMAGWGRLLPEGRALGVAAVKSYGAFVAQVAEVSIDEGAPRVRHVWCAADCGLPVNPDIIRAQMEGGVGYGLNAILFNELTIVEGGAATQSNFHDYRALRIGEMPEIDVDVAASDEPPVGAGEPGVPPIGPAVANALRRLTGKTPRRPPIINTNWV